MAKNFKPCESYVMTRNGRVYACTGVMRTRRDTVRLTPEQAAEALARNGVESPLTEHFKKKPASQQEVLERGRHGAEPQGVGHPPEDELIGDLFDMDRDELVEEAEKLGIRSAHKMRDNELMARIGAQRRAVAGPGGGDSRSGGDDGDQTRTAAGALAAAEQLEAQPGRVREGVVVTDDKQTAEQLNELLGISGEGEEGSGGTGSGRRKKKSAAKSSGGESDGNSG